MRVVSGKQSLYSSCVISLGLIVSSCATPSKTGVQTSVSSELPAKYKTMTDKCEDLNVLDLELVGDEPSKVVSTEMVIGKKATGRQSLFFKKRGHSQGNPMPEEASYPDHCLVKGYTTNHIQFALMLPMAEKWNERFMLAACDAWCGKVHPEITVPGLYQGYATLTNNGGHYSRAPFDGIWAHNDDKAVVNFAHKANHVTAQAAKAIIEEFYGSKPKYSYITGFSKGGNAGLMAVQRYPEDFDGAIVKAPVIHYNATNAAHFPWLGLAIHPDGKTPLMYSDKVELLHTSVTAACDEIDGLKDGVIDDPRKCDFKPVSLLCENGESEADNQCLNTAQVAALEKVYQKPQKNGQVYFDYPTDMGSEHDWARALLPVRGSSELPFPLTGAITGLRYMVLKDNPGPGYDWTKFDYLSNAHKIDDMARVFDPDAVDMSAFKARGGKVIIVHGWSDAMISAQMTIDWFERVRQTMGVSRVDEFAQLYVVPGMVHGSGGTGPYVFDAQTAIVDWVEKGKTPTHMMLEDEPDATPFRQRPSYPYPAYAKYKGEGDPNKASSFVKVEK